MPVKQSQGKVFGPDLNTGDVWVEFHLNEVWLARARLCMQQDQPIVAEFHIVATSAAPENPCGLPDRSPDVDSQLPQNGITTRLLSSVRLAQAIKEAQEALATYDDANASPGALQAMRNLLGDESYKPMTGRKRTPDSFLASVALFYVLSVGEGYRNALVAVVEQLAFMGHYSTRNEVAKNVDRASARGFLEDRDKGKAGGKLTKKAKDQLNKTFPGLLDMMLEAGAVIPGINKEGDPTETFWAVKGDGQSKLPDSHVAE